MLTSFVKYREFYSDERRNDLETAFSLYEKRGLLLQTVESLCFPELGKEQIEGKRVLIKPNLVRENQTEEDRYALHTNVNLILAMCELVLNFAPRSLVIAEAPLQNCIWEKVTAPLKEGLALLQEK